MCLTNKPHPSVSNHGTTEHETDGQTAEECSKSALSDAAVEQLDIYDKDLYLEPDCVNGATPLPVHCNYMGLGQECRGCYMTCDGVMQYMEDFASEVEIWVSGRQDYVDASP